MILCVQNPFKFLYRDSDVEGMTDGFDERTAYGTIEGFDDPSMGWARYAQVTCSAVLSVPSPCYSNCAAHCD